MHIRYPFRKAFPLLFVALTAGAGENPGISAPPVTAEIGADGVQRATLTLESYAFKPAHLVVRAGMPVELTLENVSTLATHNLRIDDPGRGLQVDQDVKAGKSAKVTFTPTAPGSYPYYCDKRLLMFPNHRSRGMEGILEVK